MVDSRRHRCKATGASSSSQPRPATIDGWISDQGKHADYVNSWQERRIMAVKYIRLDFYRFYGFQFPDLFAGQGLTLSGAKRLHLSRSHKSLLFQLEISRRDYIHQSERLPHNFG